MSGTVVSGVRALAARLKQVLYNYLSNALKFTPSGGTVTVRASSEGSDLFRLEVHDTGSGIQPADLPRRSSSSSNWTLDPRRSTPAPASDSR